MQTLNAQKAKQVNRLGSTVRTNDAKGAKLNMMHTGWETIQEETDTETHGLNTGTVTDMN